eukprot:Skav206293  [mRNA]  locus=scaffold5870:4298:11540:+ [translate_table: standard]
MPLSDLWKSSEPDSCGDSESSSTSSSSSEEPELQGLFKKQRQTAKARAAHISSAATKRLSRNAILERPHPAEKFKHDLNADSEIHQPSQHWYAPHWRRLRLITSYLKSWCAAVHQYFQSSPVDHCFVIGIVDDTNVRLSEVPADSQHWRVSRVANVMNTIQRLVVCGQNESDQAKRTKKTFNVITPMVVLPRADTETVAVEFQSRLLAFLGFVASRYHHLIPETLLQNVRIQGTIVLFDALKVNIAMLKHLRQAVHERHVASDSNNGSMSAQIFKSFVSGRFGNDLLGAYMDQMKQFPQLDISDVAGSFFRIGLEAMGEHWRRFCLPTKGMPYTLFGLADLERDEDFLVSYQNFQRQLQQCACCADLEFSTVILKFIAPGSVVEDPRVKLQISRLRNFLKDLCETAPLSADLVECYHGSSQALLHRWRGVKVTDNVAQERLFWKTVATQYSKFKTWIWDHTMDKGWNIFLREHVQGQQRDPDDWTAVQDRCKRIWANMSVEKRAEYEAAASAENHIRTEACLQPFQPKLKLASMKDEPVLGDAAFNAASMLSRNALKAVSRHRSLTTYARYKSSELWGHHDAGLATADGCLDLDLIDLEANEETLLGQWNIFRKSVPKKLPPLNPELHHQTCWTRHGSCKKDFQKNMVERLVSSLDSHLSSGLLSLGSLIQMKVRGCSGRFFFIAYAMKKPKQQVLLEGFQTQVLPNAGMIVDIVKHGSTIPSFCTSHQLFQEVAESDLQNGGVPFVKYEYCVNPFVQLYHVKTTNVSEEHMLSAEKKKPQSKQTVLPFGLKNIRKKRKARKPVVKQPDGKSGLAAKAASLIQQLQANGTVDVQMQHEESEIEESSGSESNSTSNANDDAAMEEPAEEPFLTAETAQEEFQIQEAFRSHEQFLDAQASMPSSSSNPSSSSVPQRVPEALASSSSSLPVSGSIPNLPSKQASATKTFCNSSTGLVEVGTQTSRRLATCRHCLDKIQQGDIRVGYAWSRVKFHSWLHIDCVSEHLVQEQADIQQASNFLKTKLEERTQHSQSVIDAMKKLSRNLQSLE